MLNKSKIKIHNGGGKLNQIAVIGSAGINSEELQFMAEKVGFTINELGYNLVTGGLSGVMEASAKGHKSGPENLQTIALLPSYDPSTANKYSDIIIPTGLDIGRNQLVVSSCLTVIVVGGGAGTLSEIALASQIGKPIILMKGSGGWADKLASDYLDQRNNSKLHHVNTFDELKAKLLALATTPSKTGAINSGHNR